MDDKLTILKNYLKGKGLTQADVAKSLDCSSAYINQLLNGTNVFTYKTAQRWHEVYGLSATWLVTGKGDMFDSDSQTISQTNNSGANVIGNNINADGDLLELLKKKDEQIAQMQEQINKLIDLLSKK